MKEMNKSQRIAEARIAAGYNKSSLAKAMGVSHTAVGLWEKGDTKNLKNDHLYKLEQLTGFSARWIATGKGEKFSRNFELSDDEADFLRDYRKAPDSEKAIIRRLLSQPSD